MEVRTATRFASSVPDSLLDAGEEPPLASHLISPRSLYDHHGIYVGNGRVIHYAGLANRPWPGPVEETSLERFARSRRLRVRHDRRSFDCMEVLARARSRLGERRYRILTNNCEHFCAWVLRGQHHSEQVNRLLAAMRSILRMLLRR